MKGKRLLTLIGSVCLVLALAVLPFMAACAKPAPAPAPAPAGPVGPSITFKVSHQWAEGDVRDRLAHALGDLVTERTGGRFSTSCHKG